MLHVPDIRKNLVSGSLLSKNGFRLIFESDKFVLTKNWMYVGKSYMSNGLFKLNVMTVVPTIINNNTSSSNLLESSNLWHGRLGHVNYEFLRTLIYIECLPKFDIASNHKCEICVEAKLSKTLFHSIERSTEPLELIHSDFCDFQSIQTRGGKKYFITFINDYTRYSYVYLIRTKDELWKLSFNIRMKLKINLVRKSRNLEVIEVVNMNHLLLGFVKNMD